MSAAYYDEDYDREIPLACAEDVALVEQMDALIGVFRERGMLSDKATLSEIREAFIADSQQVARENRNQDEYELAHMGAL